MTPQKPQVEWHQLRVTKDEFRVLRQIAAANDRTVSAQLRVTLGWALAREAAEVLGGHPRLRDYTPLGRDDDRPTP